MLNPPGPHGDWSAALVEPPVHVAIGRPLVSRRFGCDLQSRVRPACRVEGPRWPPRCRDHLFACANPERRRCSSRSGMGIEIRALAGGSISPNRAEAVQGLSTLTTPILRRPKSLKSLVRLREPNSNCIILIYNDYLKVIYQLLPTIIPTSATSASRPLRATSRPP
jgi:hypothetical protein